ncbi:MAG: CBS domain-containing protein, partial [Robiginitomaculum sp.]|nr:CBS domain-containing protein [Robiginitomaculum sp.]
TGFVHVKDLLKFLALDAPGRSAKSYPNKKIIKNILRPVIFVPPSMAADALLKKMQIGRVHMAIVVDEYGGTDGLVTLEDLIEPIVGDIEDEHDDAEPEIKTLKDKKGVPYWEVDARIDIEDFEAVLGRDIATPEQDDEVDTLGGLVFFLAGRIPERGEIIPHPLGMEFEVLEASPRQVKRLRLRQITNATKAK